MPVLLCRDWECWRLPSKQSPSAIFVLESSFPFFSQTVIISRASNQRSNNQTVPKLERLRAEALPTVASDMAGHGSPSGEQGQVSVVNHVEESLVDGLNSDAPGGGAKEFEWENDFDFSTWQGLGVSATDNLISWQDFDDLVTENVSDIEQHNPESLQQSVPTVGEQASGEKTVPSDPNGNSGIIYDRLFADGLPADTFVNFMTPSQDVEPPSSEAQLEMPAMTTAYPVTQYEPSYAPQMVSMQPTLQGQCTYIDPHSSQMQQPDIENTPLTSARFAPQKNLSPGSIELPSSRDVCERSQPTVGIKNTEEDSPLPSDDEDDGDEEEGGEEEVPREDRKPDPPVHADSSDIKRQKREFPSARRLPIQQAPRQKNRSNPMYTPKTRYSHVPHPSQDWSCFKYSKDGELKPSRLYSVEEIDRYLWKHPLNQQASDKKSSELILRIHRNPPRSRGRFPTMHSHRCRFEDCPATNGTINQGHIVVSLCEMDVSHPNHDPFIEAGWVHLYCLESFTDFPKICAELNIRADMRELPKEDRGKNLMKFGTLAEAKLVDKFIKACQNGRRPVSYPEQVDGEEYEYEGTLCHRLACRKVKKEPGTYAIQRAARKTLAGYQGSNIGTHMGDLVVEAELRGNTRRHKNQNSNLENPKALRAYRKQEDENIKSEDDSDSDSGNDCEAEDKDKGKDEDDDEAFQQWWIQTHLQRPLKRRARVSDDGSANEDEEDDEATQQQWIQTHLQRPLPRRAPVAPMTPSSPPPPQRQRPMPARRAPTKNYLFVEQWLQSKEGWPTPPANLGPRQQPHQPRPQYKIPRPYTGPPPQLPGQYYVAPQLQAPVRLPAQFSPMAYMGPVAHIAAQPSMWTPVPSNYVPPPLSRKRTSDEAGNAPAPIRYGQVPGYRPNPPNPQAQGPTRKRAYDESDDNEPPKKTIRAPRLAPSPREKAHKVKKRKAPRHRKTAEDMKNEILLDAQIREEWDKEYNPDMIAQRAAKSQALQEQEREYQELLLMGEGEEEEMPMQQSIVSRSAMREVDELFGEDDREVEQGEEHVGGLEGVSPDEVARKENRIGIAYDEAYAAPK